MIMISTPHNLYICSGYNDCDNYERYSREYLSTPHIVNCNIWNQWNTPHIAT